MAGVGQVRFDPLSDLTNLDVSWCVAWSNMRSYALSYHYEHHLRSLFNKSLVYTDPQPTDPLNGASLFLIHGNLVGCAGNITDSILIQSGDITAKLILLNVVEGMYQ